MRINENIITKKFEIVDISTIGMFYIVEKAFESCQRWERNNQFVKENPLWPILKWYADNSSIPLWELTEPVCEFVTHHS